MNTRKLFETHVASKFGAQANAVMREFNALVSRYGEDKALDIMLDIFKQLRAQLQATASLPLSPRAEQIRKELEIANRTKSIETNSVVRLRSVLEKLRQNILKCSVEIDGKALSQEEIESALPQIPSCFKDLTTYTASARCKDGKVKSLCVNVVS